MHFLHMKEGIFRLFYIVYLLAGVIQTYANFCFLSSFYEESRFSRRGEFFCYLGMYAATTFIYLLFGIPVITLIGSLLSYILVAESYVGSVAKGIAVGTLGYIFMTLVEGLVAVLIGYMNHNMFEIGENYSLIGVILLPFFQYLAAQIVRRFKNLKQMERVTLSQGVITFIVPILSIVLFLILYHQRSIARTELLAATMIIIVVNIIVLVIYEHQIEDLKIRQENALLEMQCIYQNEQFRVMREFEQTLRSQRHDFIKHISTLQYMNENGLQKEIAAYLGDMNRDYQSTKNYISSGNLVVDSILNYKIREGREKGITFYTDVRLPEKLELPAYQINTILTNLLDNSIRAVQKVDEKIIRFAMKYDRGKITIWIANPYDKIRGKRNGDFISERGKNHGFGLRNVKKAVKELGGDLQIHTDNYIFDLILYVYLGK